MTKEYELVPENEISELKKEIKNLKNFISSSSNKKGGKKDKGDDETKQLILAIKELTLIFKQAVEELKKEEKENKVEGHGDKKSETKSMKEGSSNEEQFNKKIDVLIEQNNKIAKGIVALADLLENNLQKLTEGLLQQPKIKYIRIPIPPQNTNSGQINSQMNSMYLNQIQPNPPYPQNPNYRTQNQQYPTPNSIQAYGQSTSIQQGSQVQIKKIQPQQLNNTQLKGQVIPNAPKRVQANTGLSLKPKPKKTRRILNF